MSSRDPARSALKVPRLTKVSRRSEAGPIRFSLVLLATCLAVVALMAACSPRSSQQVTPQTTAITGATSAPDGAALLEERCSVCHSADRARQAKKTSDEWEATVTRMVSKGAQLTEPEQAVLVAYLAETYGP
jgi:mono/diheme cytochrome c family protein